MLLFQIHYIDVMYFDSLYIDVCTLEESYFQISLWQFFFSMSPLTKYLQNTNFFSPSFCFVHFRVCSPPKREREVNWKEVGGKRRRNWTIDESKYPKWRVIDEPVPSEIRIIKWSWDIWVIYSIYRKKNMVGNSQSKRESSVSLRVY